LVYSVTANILIKVLLHQLF